MASKTRRRLLGTSAALVLLALSPLRICTARRLEARGEPLLQLPNGLRILLTSLPAAPVIGRAYLAEIDVCRDVLLGWLIADLALDAMTAYELDARALTARLRTRIGHDFANGRVVRLRGWLLSETELRVCALAALEGDVNSRSAG
jgi:hypothetical protein